MHLKREERCPIKSKSHLQNLFCICPSLSGMQTRHIFAFCFPFLHFVLLVFDLARTLASSFFRNYFSEDAIFFVLLTENQCFHAMGRFVCPKKGCSLDLTFARMARFSTKAFLSQKSELETRKMVFHEMYHVWKKERILLSTSVILTKSQCYKIMRMNYVETCKILQYTLTRKLIHVKKAWHLLS